MIKVYLACPYLAKGADLNQVEKASIEVSRFLQVTEVAGELMKHGFLVYSPITHSHPIHKLCKGISGSWDFWKQIDTEYLRWVDCCVVLCLEGWEYSQGVRAEIDIAQSYKKNVYYINEPDDLPVVAQIINLTYKEQ